MQFMTWFAVYLWNVSLQGESVLFFEDLKTTVPLAYLEVIFGLFIGSEDVYQLDIRFYS